MTKQFPEGIFPPIFIGTRWYKFNPSFTQLIPRILPGPTQVQG